MECVRNGTEACAAADATTDRVPRITANIERIFLFMYTFLFRFYFFVKAKEKEETIHLELCMWRQPKPAGF